MLVLVQALALVVGPNRSSSLAYRSCHHPGRHYYYHHRRLQAFHQSYYSRCQPHQPPPPATGLAVVARTPCQSSTEASYFCLHP